MNDEGHSIDHAAETANQQDRPEYDHSLVCSTPRIPPAETHDDGTQQNGYPAINWGRLRFGLEVLMLVVVAGGVSVYLGQLGEMKAANDVAQQALNKSVRDSIESAKSSAESLSLARLSLRLSQRAFLASGAPEVNFSKQFVSVPIANSGRLPAGNLRANAVQIRMIGTTILPGATSQPFPSTYQHLSPGTPLNLVIDLKDLSEPEAEHIKAGKIKLLIAGLITYDDGFGEDDRVGFCMTYNSRQPDRWNTCPSL